MEDKEKGCKGDRVTEMMERRKVWSLNSNENEGGSVAIMAPPESPSWLLVVSSLGTWS